MDSQGRLRQEFSLKLMRLDHREPHDFTRSPWFSSPKWYLVYRTVICLYQICTYATTKALYGISAKSLFYLTDLGYIILTAHTIVGAWLCFRDSYGSRSHPKSSDDRPSFPDNDVQTTTRPATTLSLYYKGYWVLYNVAFAIGLYITIGFWAVPGGNVDPHSILFNIMNAVVIVIDVFVSGLPYRLMHLVYPSAFGLAYMVFVVIYWAAGGISVYGRPWLRGYLDYGDHPGMAAGIAAASVLVAIPLCHAILYGLALAREMLPGVVQGRMRSRNSIRDGGVPMEQHRDIFNA